MEPVVVGVVFALVVLAAIYAGYAQYQAWSRELTAFRARLDGGSGRTRLGVFDGLTDASVSGLLDGGRVSLRFETRGSGKSKYHVALYEVPVEHPVASFTAQDEGLLDGVWRWLGLSSTTKLSADVKLAGGGAAERLFRQSQDLHRVVRRLLALPGEQRGVRLEGRRLLLERRAGAGVIDAQDLERTFRMLQQVAALCGRRRVEGIKVRARETFAWTGGGEAALCPYCREGVQADADDVAACERCGTLHHAACLEEARGCTIFGCRTPDERARARGA